MLDFDRSTVKHGTHNILNDCHQWLSGSFRVHQIFLAIGGAYSASPDPLVGLRGFASKAGRGRGKGKEEG